MMANKRLFLKCTACGERFFLGKHYQNGWFLNNYHEDAGSVQDQLNNFYEKPTYCHGYPLECFEIEYEVGSDMGRADE